MDEKKKKKNIFLKIIGLLFVIYFSLYLMENLGYYNINTKNKVLTEEAIKEFEKDVKNGRSIDIKNYVGDNTNYKNFYSNIGYNVSVSIDNVFNKGLKKVGNFLKKLFN